MAATTQPIVGDTPSDEVTLALQQITLLVEWVTAFDEALADAADLTALKAAVADIDIHCHRHWHRHRRRYCFRNRAHICSYMYSSSGR